MRHASSATSNRLGDFERGVLFERNALQTVLKNFEDVAAARRRRVLFTYLHRLHHYATTRNANASELTREPFSTAAKSIAQLLGRVRRQTVRPQAAGDDRRSADDDAVPRVRLDHAHGERIAAKRARRSETAHGAAIARSSNASRCTIVPTYPGDEALMRGALFRLLRPSLPSIERKLADIMRT